MSVLARMKLKPLWIVLLLIAGAGGVAALRFFGRSTQASEDRIQISGNIELEQVNIAFKVSGRLVERTVQEGDPVTKGMLLARLDQDQLRSQRAQEEAELRSAEALLAQARTSLEFQIRSNQAELQIKQAEEQTADAQLKDLQVGPRPQEVQDATAALEGAQAEFARARDDLERSERLQKEDDIPLSQLEVARTKFESTQATLKQAQQHLALVKAGTRPDTIDAAKGQLARAQAVVAEQAANELQVKRDEQELAVRQADIDRSQAQINLIDTQLKETEAHSPIDGVVLVKSAEVGEILAPGTPVMTVGDLEHPWLLAYIGEQDLGRVKIGSRARVTTDSFPGRVYAGRVIFISSEAEFTPKQIQTTDGRVRLVYRIKIGIDNPRRELKSNMPADAEILLSG